MQQNTQILKLEMYECKIKFDDSNLWKQCLFIPAETENIAEYECLFIPTETENIAEYECLNVRYIFSI